MAWNAFGGTDPQRAALAYARVGVETGVGAADPHRLVLMLFDGALQCLREAQGHLQRGDTPAKGLALSRAIQIIEEGLAASVDEAAGGELARQLKDLYGYLARRIVRANRTNDSAVLQEAARLLGELRGAWQDIAPGGAQP
jgi:flagellar protein FliS